MAAMPWVVLTYQTPHGRQPATDYVTELEGAQLVLLDGFTKKRQDIPADALKRIRAMAKEMREAEEPKTTSPKKHSRRPKR